MKSLLVLRLSALGDIIHTMPAVVALAQSMGPRVRIGWVVESPFAELVEMVAPVDAVFRASTKRWRRQLLAGAARREMANLTRELRRFGRGETSVDFQGLAKSALMGFLSGAARRFGFARGSVRERLAGLLYTDRVEVDRSGHVVEWNFALARAAGAEAMSIPRPDYSRFAIDTSGTLRTLADLRPVVLIPGAGQPPKQWNIDRFTLLAERLTKLLGSGPVVVWGPGEQHLAETVASGGAAKVAPPTDLRQLAFLLRHSRLVIAADTGPLHLADAMGTPVIGLYGPTNPQRNGPYHQLERCIETYSTTRQMDTISVDAVFRKVQEVLS